jgi:ATP-binding cassette, subfamily B, bacterial PglK
MYSQLKKIFHFFDRRTKVRMLGLFSLIALIMVFELIGLGLFLPLLQLLSNPEKINSMPYLSDLFMAIGQESHTLFILYFAAIIAVFFIVKNFAVLGLHFLQGRFICEQEAEFSTRLFGAYLARPYPFHLKRNSANLMHNVTAATSMVFHAGLLPFFNLILEGAVSIAVFGALLFFAPVAAATAGAVLSITLAIYYLILRKRLLYYGDRIYHHGSAAKVWINQGLGSIKESKILGRESFFQTAFGQHRSDEAIYRNLSYVATLSPRPLLESAAVVVLVIVMAVLSFRPEGQEEILPTLGIFGIAAFRLLPSLNRIASQSAQIKLGAAAVENIYEDYMAIERDKTLGHNGYNDADTSHFEELKLDRVHYHYEEGNRAAVDDISLSVKAGESIAFVGASGSGKTTLSDIILGLLNPTKGTVYVDQCDMYEKPSLWQSRVGYVPQSIYLFDDTVRRNVALGLADDKIDDARIAHALELAAMGDVVRNMEKGLNTVLGEHGSRLSGGQRQRIGIARALYNDPEIIILDEATSALDSETESGIMDSINALKGQKTLIIIAHRMSTVKNCDRLFVLKDGQIISTGTFDELSVSSNDFKRLISPQPHDAGQADPG